MGEYVFKEWDPDNLVAIAGFATTDEHGKMARISFVLEEGIDHLILSLKLVKSETLKRMNFRTKILILRSLRFSKNICDALSKIYDIRNDFAHSKEACFENHREKIELIVEEHGITYPKGINGVVITIEENVYKIDQVELGNKLMFVAVVIGSFFGISAETFDFPEPKPKIFS